MAFGKQKDSQGLMAEYLLRDGIRGDSQACQLKCRM